MARPGELTLVAATGGAPAAVGRFSLPKRAQRTRWGVRITSPKVHRVADEPATPAAPPCWAVGPEAFGKRRLRTLLYCLGPGGEPEEPVEAWSLLPAGETVTETVYTRFEGRPMLVTLTREKLGLFVKQRLRAFPLEASRTRVGTEPTLATETVCPIWHDSALGFADADGDGRHDLYLVCEKGLIDQELRLEVYRGTGRGTGEPGFDPRVSDIELDGEFGSWLFGQDWTGDGLPDLLAVRDGAIELHAGTGGRRHPIDRHAVTSTALVAPNEVDHTITVEARVGSNEGPADGELTVELGGPASSAQRTSTATAAPSSSPTGTASRAACWWFSRSNELAS